MSVNLTNTGDQQSLPTASALYGSNQALTAQEGQTPPKLSCSSVTLLAEAARDLASLASSFNMRLYLLQKMPSQSGEHLQALESMVAYLDELAHELMEVSRPADSPRETAVLDLNPIVHHVIQAYKPVADRKGIRLTFEASPDLWALWAADLDIKRIVINLVCNALKYTPAGGTVALATSRVGNDDLLTVRDSGIGISPEDLPHIFDRLYRGDEAQRAASGMGLGLPIAVALTEKYGGHIEVESKPGEGSIFKVVLPGLS
ncbi:MAG TPA: HAMP domain-containing sensor histidine kinase [Aggregatilineales bacterium]|nr:HAMP domain-containing sensor histidine kinase [Aggregatilineales bacterium]